MPLVSSATEHKFGRVVWLTSMSVGAFVAAPVGGLLWGGGAFALRVGLQWIQAKRKGHKFDAFDRPPITQSPPYTSGAVSSDEEHEGPQEPEEHIAPISMSPQKGNFF